MIEFIKTLPNEELLEEEEATNPYILQKRQFLNLDRQDWNVNDSFGGHTEASDKTKMIQ